MSAARIAIIAGAALVTAMALLVLFKVGVGIDFAVQPSSFEDLPRVALHTRNIDLAEDGSLTVERAPTDLAHLTHDLDAAFLAAGASKDRSQQPVIIWASPKTPSKDLRAVQDVLAASGWSRVSLSSSASNMKRP